MIWSTEQEKDSIGEMIAATASHLVFQVLDAANAYRSDAGGWTFSDANHPPAADPIEALTPVFNELAKTIELLRKADFQLSVDAAF